jgi:Protein of unknown function (DUF3363)
MGEDKGPTAGENWRCRRKARDNGRFVIHTALEFRGATHDAADLLAEVLLERRPPRHKLETEPAPAYRPPRRRGLAQGQRIVFARDLLDTLKRRDLAAAVSRLSDETGARAPPSGEGEHVSGVYRQHVTLASGRFAMIEFQHDDVRSGAQGRGQPLASGRRSVARHPAIRSSCHT